MKSPMARDAQRSYPTAASDIWTRFTVTNGWAHTSVTLNTSTQKKPCRKLASLWHDVQRFRPNLGGSMRATADLERSYNESKRERNERSHCGILAALVSTNREQVTGEGPPLLLSLCGRRRDDLSQVGR